MDKPTPTPWEVCKYITGTGTLLYGIRNAVFGEQSPYPGHLIGPKSMLSTAEQSVVTECWFTDKKEDAEFIVRAVNAHEELIKTLEHVREKLGGKLDVTDQAALQGIVGKAIDRAEGK